MGHFRPTAGVLPVFCRFRRGEQAYSLRSAGGRERALLRLLHGIRGHEIRDVLLRRVRGNRDGLDAPRDDLSRWMGAAVPASRRPYDLVREPRGRPRPRLAHVDDRSRRPYVLRKGHPGVRGPNLRALDASALSLRSAHETGLEDSAARLTRERSGYRGGLPGDRHGGPG